MADFITYDEKNKHRGPHIDPVTGEPHPGYIGSTVIADMMGQGYGYNGNWGLCLQYREGLTEDFSNNKAIAGGNDFEEIVLKKGCERLVSLLREGGHEVPTGFQVWQRGNKAPDGRPLYHKTLTASEWFTPEELMAWNIDHKLQIFTNSSPDAAIFPSAKHKKPFAVCEAKLREYTQKHFKDQLVNEPIEGYPGAGLPWYGQELTNQVLPAEYIQDQWHMFHTDTEICYHYACFSMAYDETMAFIVPRDEPFIKEMVQAAFKWWNKHIVNGVDPGPEQSKGFEWLVKAKTEIKGEIRPASNQETELACDYAEAAFHMQAWKDKADTFKLELMEAIGEDSGISFENLGKMTFKTNAKGKRTFGARGFNIKLAAGVPNE